MKESGRSTDSSIKGRLGRFGKIYGVFSGLAATFMVGYLLLISFPQVLFANSVTYGHFTVYSNASTGTDLERVLDSAEARLKTSPIYDESISRRVFMTDSFGVYALLSHKAYNSFGNTVPLINNIIINRSDAAQDLVFMNRPVHNSRSLSGVIAHEVTHHLIRRKYGELAGMTMPKWKNEGYCEYVAGSSTITYDEGVSLWRAAPGDDAEYKFFKYHMMVKYLLETEKMNIDDFFTLPMNENDIAAKTFAGLK